mgnify:CR=1 FL=1|jgi:hypothetical protein
MAPEGSGVRGDPGNLNVRVMAGCLVLNRAPCFLFGLTFADGRGETG